MISPYVYPAIQQIGIKNYKSNEQQEREIINLVCFKLDLKHSDVFSPKRNSELVFARNVISFILREVCQYSFINTARIFGREEHSTTLHGINQVKNLCEYDESIFNQLHSIVNEVDREFASNLKTFLKTKF